jgi:hypothetical protein
MKIPKLGIVVAVLLAVLSLMFAVIPAVAAATYPCLFHGTATVDGVPVTAGTEISFWVEGAEVASTVTGAGGLPDNIIVGKSLEVEFDYLEPFTWRYLFGHCSCLLC